MRVVAQVFVIVELVVTYGLAVCALFAMGQEYACESAMASGEMVHRAKPVANVLIRAGRLAASRRKLERRWVGRMSAMAPSACRAETSVSFGKQDLVQ